MAVPTSRDEFKQYCLRRLGAPIINVEVTDEQLDDCVDEALSFYGDYHFDGSYKVYLKHQVTAEDKVNRYVEIPSEITGIVGIFPIGAGLSSTGMFDVRYQYALNEMANLASFSLVDYYMTLTNIKFMEQLLVGQQPVRYNRHINKLYIDMNWSKMEIGEYIIIDAQTLTDPETYSDVWSDRWLQNYCIAKIKYQWAAPLTKFANGMLPGNLQFNADKMMDDAYAEIRRMEDEMLIQYSIPPDFEIG